MCELNVHTPRTPIPRTGSRGDVGQLMLVFLTGVLIKEREMLFQEVMGTS